MAAARMVGASSSASSSDACGDMCFSSTLSLNRTRFLVEALIMIDALLHMYRGTVRKTSSL